jgi:4-alpha-glucanotransferase
MSRTAGVTLPLFSLRTRGDWGIGQIGDLPAFGAWIRTAGHRLVQILPAMELAAGETSPYGARTAFGLDPIYVTVEGIPDLDAAAIAQALGPDGLRDRDAARGAPTVDYPRVRELKSRALAAAFARFHEREWKRSTPRADALRAFIAAERAWCDDLALYVALRDRRAGHGWSTWPAAERDRDPTAMAQARADLATDILRHQYAQWIAHLEWDRARAALRKDGVELMGDMPFIVCAESADVWAHRDEFRLDASLGAPPDAFSADGQDWGLPAYDWPAMDKTDLAWLRARTRHAARLYDRFRLDHVVGYFRMWTRRPGERGAFTPDGDDAQRARGETILRAVIEAAGETRVIAEDLGVIPPFVRETMRALGVPGYRVIPWEKDEHFRYRNPRDFPAASVATWSTHDTKPITSWWGDLEGWERDQLDDVMGTRGAPDDARNDAWLRTLLGAGSDLTLAQAQELLGQPDRVNLPGSVGPHNWAYRLPMPVEALAADAATRARMEAIARMAAEAGRG